MPVVGVIFGYIVPEFWLGRPGQEAPEGRSC